MVRAARALIEIGHFPHDMSDIPVYCAHSFFQMINPGLPHRSTVTTHSFSFCIFVIACHEVLLPVRKVCLSVILAVGLRNQSDACKARKRRGLV